MYVVKMKIDGRIGKRSYDNEVKTESQHETREVAEAVVRGYYRDFVNDGAKPEGTDADFTVRVRNEAARVVVSEHFYIEEYY